MVFSFFCFRDKIVSKEFMRKYIHIAKAVTPVLTEEAANHIAEEYSRLRSQEQMGADLARVSRSMDTPFISTQEVIECTHTHTIRCTALIRLLPQDYGGLFCCTCEGGTACAAIVLISTCSLVTSPHSLHYSAQRQPEQRCDRPFSQLTH